MQTLTRHLLRQITLTLGVCVGVFYLVLLLGNVLRDILDLLATRSASLTEAVQAIGYLSPFVLAFALPISLLTAVLLVFGRLSADQEITAARASGVSLVALTGPVLGLAAVLSVVCAWFNMSLGPSGRARFVQLRDSAVRSRALQFLRENTYCRVGDLDVYVSRISGTNLQNLLLYQYTNSVKIAEISARRGNLLLGTNGLPVGLELLEATTLTPQGDEWMPGYNESVRIPFRPQGPTELELRYSDMTLSQLLAERTKLRATGKNDTPVQVQIHRQLAFSFACLGFALVGVPLGVRTHRRETNIGIAIALGLVLVYYSFIVLGQALETQEHWHPSLILWVPNFVFQGLGAWLLYRVNRGR